MYQSGFTTGDIITLILAAVGYLIGLVVVYIKLQNEVISTKVGAETKIEELRCRIERDESKMDNMETCHRQDMKEIYDKIDSNYKGLNAKIDQVLVILIENNGGKKKV